MAARIAIIAATTASSTIVKPAHSRAEPASVRAAPRDVLVSIGRRPPSPESVVEAPESRPARRRAPARPGAIPRTVISAIARVPRAFGATGTSSDDAAPFDVARSAIAGVAAEDRARDRGLATTDGSKRIATVAAREAAGAGRADQDRLLSRRARATGRPGRSRAAPRCGRTASRTFDRRRRGAETSRRASAAPAAAAAAAALRPAVRRRWRRVRKMSRGRARRAPG